MAQRIVTVCDAHQAREEEAAGAPWQVSVLAPGESKPTTWEVDLCPEDGKPLEDLAEMLRLIGRQTEGPKRRNGASAPRDVAGRIPPGSRARWRVAGRCPRQTGD